MRRNLVVCVIVEDSVPGLQAFSATADGEVAVPKVGLLVISTWPKGVALEADEPVEGVMGCGAHRYPLPS